MSIYGHWLVKGRHAWWVLAVVAVLSALAVSQSMRLQTEDDLLAFLPEDSSEVGQFRAINQEFGGLDVVLIGVHADQGVDREFLEKLDRVSQRIKELDDVGNVLSLTTFKHVTRNEGETAFQFADLMGELPKSDLEVADLMNRVLNEDLAVGQVVNAQGTSFVIYAFARPGAEPRILVDKIEQEVFEQFGEEQVVFGGSAPVSNHIFTTTKMDMETLTPWAIGVILAIMLVAFRDVRGAVLAVVSTGIGVLFSHAAMVVAGVPLNVVLSSMPIILFAVGSAYGIHFMARYRWYALSGAVAPALIRTLERTGPTIVVSGLTTAIGLASFLMMDIAPLRQFGLFTSFGILIILASSLTLVPAVIWLAQLPGRGDSSSGLLSFLVPLLAATRRTRRLLACVVFGLVALGSYWLAQVDSRVDQSAFYTKESPPDRADQFMQDQFGGSQFIQIQVEGDLKEPGVLREIQRIGDTVRLVPGVSRVNHVADVLSVGNRVFDGWYRIPDTREQVATTFAFVLENEPALGQLINGARTKALMHVQIRGTTPDEVDPILQSVETIVADQARVVLDGETESGRRDRVARRLLALTHSAGFPSPLMVEEVCDRLDSFEVTPDRATLFRSFEELLLSPDQVDFTGVPISADQAKDIASALADGTDWRVQRDALFERVVALAPSEEVVFDYEFVAEFLFSNLEGPQQEALEVGVQGALLRLLEIEAGSSPRFQRLQQHLIQTLGDLQPSEATSMQESHDLAWSVSGQPVMHRGLSNSVRDNQWRSLVLALTLVTILLGLFLRNLWSGLLGAAPMVVALVCIYGGMGFFGIRLDIGTSMLASLIIGAGVDYAVHFLAAWRVRQGEDDSWGAARAAARTGPAILTNALMVSAGFFVLTLGDARPLKNVGGLTASAMLVAAIATMLVLPILCRRKKYTGTACDTDPTDPLVEQILTGARGLARERRTQ